MQQIQKIVINNEEFIVLPKAKFDKLVDIIEDKIDAANLSYDKDEETFPMDLVDNLFDNPKQKIKIWRKYRKMTATELAKKVNVSQSYISEIETGKKDGSISVLIKIAENLEVDLDMLF